MSTSLPPSVLRRALITSVSSHTTPHQMTEKELRRVGEALEEAGYLIVSRADVHALRAAADKVLRFTPAVDPRLVWCGVTGCTLSGIREHGHQGGSPTPTR